MIVPLPLLDSLEKDPPERSTRSLLAVIVPIVCLVLIALLCLFVIWKAGPLFIGRMKIK